MMRDNFNDTIENQAMKMKSTAQNIREMFEMEKSVREKERRAKKVKERRA